MRRILHVLILAVLFAACHKDDPDPIEIATNNDVESGNTVPYAWSNYSVSPYTASWTTEEASSGTKSLKIIASSSDQTNIGFWSQFFTQEIPNGRDVILSVKIKCKNVTGRGVSIAIRGDDSSSNLASEQFSSTEGVEAIKGDFEWKTYQVRMNKVGDDITSLTVYLILLHQTTGTVYFDDVSLQVL